MSDEDLTRPIRVNVPERATNKTPSIDTQAATVPVGFEELASSTSSLPDAIQPTPAFMAADAETTGQIVLPVGLRSQKSARKTIETPASKAAVTPGGSAASVTTGASASRAAAAGAPVGMSADATASAGQVASAATTAGRAASATDPASERAPLFAQGEADSLAAGQSAVGAPAYESSAAADPEETALFLGAFFQELARCGVTDFVVSPGSRSTGLAMVALESAGEVYMDVDERGAAFFALGLAKATGNPVAVICTSGTAPANWLPAVLEAEASRVPLLLLSADRPPRLQNLSAHQTTDQLGLFGNHVKRFYQMPLPAANDETLAYARQVALDAAIAAHGVMPGARSCDGGPVHVNFPFEEPLKPASLEAVRSRLDALAEKRALPPTVVPGQVLFDRDASGLMRVIAGKRVLALCGEGAANNASEAEALVAFAEARQVPLLADPLSGLRSINAPCVIDNYDTVLGAPGALLPDVVIRFGRWPVSKRATTVLGACGAVQLVVDMRDTRDANAATTTLVRTSPVAFARALTAVEGDTRANGSFYTQWCVANDEAARRIAQVGLLTNMDDFEGAYVDALFDLVPADSLVFSANSMAIRAIDTFYRKTSPACDVLCNRGLSGIDGTLSAAIGAAHAYSQTTVITGDLAFLHDSNALALQAELRTREHRGAGQRPSIVVVVLNNNGGGIFDMLPQQSSEDYFERLFLTPQRFNIKELAAAFEVPYRRATTVAMMRRSYAAMLGQPGVGIIEVPVPLAGVRERYDQFW